MTLGSMLLAVALATCGDAAGEALADFSKLVEAKDFDAAKKCAASLGSRLGALRDELAATPPPAAARQKECVVEQGQILAAFERVVKDPRAPIDLQTALLAAAGKVTGEGEQLALRAIKLRHVVESGALLAAGLRTIGARPDAKRIELFERHLDDDRPEVVNAAADSLGAHYAASEAVRKRVVASLVAGYSASGMTALESGGAPDPKNRQSLGDLEFRFAVRDAYRRALARLTGGVDFRTADEWAAWHREAKDKKWRDGVDRPDVKLDGLHGGPAPKRN